jgi:hypothetical protein
VCTALLVNWLPVSVECFVVDFIAGRIVVNVLL